MLSLEISWEHVSHTSHLCLVDWALVKVLLFLASLWEWSSAALDNWHDREVLLRSRVLKLTDLSVPSSTLDLEAPDVGTVFAGWKCFVPVEVLEDVGLDVQLVELGALFLSVDLLNGSQEGLRVEQSVEEGDVRDLSWVVLPAVQLVESLLDVVKPGIETTSGWEGLSLPSGRYLVKEDGVHDHLHSGSHGKLSLEGKLDVEQVSHDNGDQVVHVGALLQERVLEWSPGVVTNSVDNLIDVQLVGVKRALIVNTLDELNNLFLNWVTTITSAATLWLDLLESLEENNTFLGTEVNLCIGVETVSVGSFWRSLLNVLSVLVISGVGRASEHFFVDEWEELSLVHQVFLHEVVEEGGASNGHVGSSGGCGSSCGGSVGICSSGGGCGSIG